WDGVQTPKQGGGYIYKLILQKLFKDYGFKESEDSIQQKANAPATYTGEGMPDPITVTNGDVSCTISATQYTAETVCDSMQIQKYLAQRMKPFADAYAKGSQTWIKDIVAGPLVIKSEKVEGNYPIMASRTSGYDVAEMVTQMGDKRRIALFYANYNKSSEWHYITEATDEFGFPCKDIMKSRDARKAMYDQICYQDGVGQIRVDNDRLTLQ
ncbi:MAG TPA: hypothetical protein VLA92_02820, partial [Candidatus Saccharimonadales bacterium]|nr:hypothetical protein [Candidatus Saccharimonadales bacterium]